MIRHRSTPVSVTIVALVLLGACATTIDDEASNAGEIPAGATPAEDYTEPIEGGVIVDSLPQTTAPVSGSAAELLPEIATEMSRLGSLIADGGDDDAALARIEAVWDSIRPEIDSTRPELVNGIGTTVDMARVAVERKQPADADKAFSILTDLVDKFTGDG
jgi:ABC-type Fe3+-hydroxamate transport system substrate-binding protein